MYPASMTKIMTMILVMEAIKENKITLDTIVIGSKNASKQPGSSIFLSENEKISVRDLLKGVCIASGNDASYQLAEKVSGTESLFVKEMNNKAKELNLKNTNFMNTTGLPDKGHYSSAFDIITMSSYLINNYPEILEYTKIYEDYLRKDSDKPFWLVNTNKLVKSHPDIDGLKSGWTEEALYCLSSTMMRDNQRFISVVMGCESVEKRNEDTISLLEYGLSNYESVKIYDKNKIVYSHYDIRYNPTTIDVILNKDIYILKKKNEELKEVNYNIVLKKDYLKNLNNAGTLELIYDNKIYSKHNLVIEDKINKNSILEIFKNLVKEYI